MPQRLLHKAQVLKSLTKRNLSTQTWISHKSLKPHKQVLGRAHKGFRDEYFCWWNHHPPTKGGGSFYTCPPPPKTSCWELANKNQNIRNLNYTRYRQNRTIRFGKPACPVFSGSVRCEVYVATVFHSSHLRFLGYVEH
jgi:hypothetical protein